MGRELISDMIHLVVKLYCAPPFGGSLMTNGGRVYIGWSMSVVICGCNIRMVGMKGVNTCPGQ